MARKNETKTDLGVLTEDLGMQINAFPKLISLDYSNPPRLVMKLEKEAAGFLRKVSAILICKRIVLVLKRGV